MASPVSAIQLSENALPLFKSPVAEIEEYVASANFLDALTRLQDLVSDLSLALAPSDAKALRIQVITARQQHRRIVLANRTGASAAPLTEDGLARFILEICYEAADKARASTKPSDPPKASAQTATKEAMKPGQLIDVAPGRSQHERGPTDEPGEPLFARYRATLPPVDVAVRNISFSYANSDPILKDVTFEVTRGEILAVVGKNGSGKSTLLQVLAGRLAVQRGTIEYPQFGFPSLG